MDDMMKKLSFCLGAAFLAPSLMAFSFRLKGIDFQDADYSVNIGSRLVNIGDRTSTGGHSLLGGAKSTATAASEGTVSSLYHITPMASFAGSALLKIGDSDRFNFRVAAEVQLSSATSNTIYDGESKTAKVTLATYPARIVSLYTYDGYMYATNGYDVLEAARVSLKDVTGGKRECTVSHQPAFGLRVLYTIGKTAHSGNIGIGVMRTKDSYSYVVEETKAAAENAGIYSASDASYGIAITTVPNTSLTETLNIIPNTSDEAGNNNLPDYQQDNHETINSTSLVPSLGATATYDESAWWIGLVSEATTEINDTFLAKCGVGYYRRQFEASKNASVAAPMIVSDTNAEMYVGHVGIVYLKNKSEEMPSSVMDNSPKPRYFKPYSGFSPFDETPSPYLNENSQNKNSQADEVDESVIEESEQDESYDSSDESYDNVNESHDNGDDESYSDESESYESEDI